MPAVDANEIGSVISVSTTRPLRCVGIRTERSRTHSAIREFLRSDDVIRGDALFNPVDQSIKHAVVGGIVAMRIGCITAGMPNWSRHHEKSSELVDLLNAAISG